MPAGPTKVRHIQAHTVLLEEDGFALSIFLDGRSAADRDAAFIMQFPLDPRDGDEPYLEIPPQRFASDGGLLRCAIHSDHILIAVGAEAGQRLGGPRQWHIAYPPAQTRELVAFARRAFGRHKNLLSVEVS